MTGHYVPHFTVNQNFSSAVGIWDQVYIFVFFTLFKTKIKWNNKWWKKDNVEISVG